jgi:hypothetical protein
LHAQSATELLPMCGFADRVCSYSLACKFKFSDGLALFGVMPTQYVLILASTIIGQRNHLLSLYRMLRPCAPTKSPAGIARM